MKALWAGMAPFWPYHSSLLWSWKVGPRGNSRGLQVFDKFCCWKIRPWGQLAPPPPLTPSSPFWTKFNEKNDQWPSDKNLNLNESSRAEVKGVKKSRIGWIRWVQSAATSPGNIAIELEIILSGRDDVIWSKVLLRFSGPSSYVILFSCLGFDGGCESPLCL